MWIAIYVAIAATVVGSLIGIYASHRAIRYITPAPTYRTVVDAVAYHGHGTYTMDCGHATNDESCEH